MSYIENGSKCTSVIYEQNMCVYQSPWKWLPLYQNDVAVPQNPSRHKLLTTTLIFIRRLLRDSSLRPKQVLKPADNDVTCKIWGFHSPAAKDSRILGCETAPLRTSLPVFGRILLPSSPRVKHSRKPLKKIAQWSSKTNYSPKTWCHTSQYLNHQPSKPLLSWRWQRKW